MYIHSGVCFIKEVYQTSLVSLIDRLVYQDRPLMGVLGLCNTTVAMSLSGQTPNLHIMAGIISLAI